jgi:hypothetical protein
MGFFSSLVSDYVRGFFSHPRAWYLENVRTGVIEPGPTRFYADDIIVCGTPADAGFVMTPDNFCRQFTGTTLPSGFYVPAPAKTHGWFPDYHQGSILLVLLALDQGRELIRTRKPPS